MLTRLPFRNEIERNRRKVMEINFFLDNQQIEFENLMADLRLNLKDGQVLEMTESGEILVEEVVDVLLENSVADTEDVI